MERGIDWFLSPQAVPPSRVLSSVVTSGACQRGAAGAMLPGAWHRRSRLMLGTLCVLVLCLQVLSGPARAQVFRAFTPRFSTNDNGDILIIGNTLLSCSTSSKCTNSVICLYVHHTDAGREWAYDRQSNIGRLNKGLDEAQARGWTVVDMRRDWKMIFPFEKK